MKAHRPDTTYRVHVCPATGKQQHRTFNGAHAHHLRLLGSRHAADGPFQEYRCPSCGWWHVGHAR